MSYPKVLDICMF